MTPEPDDTMAVVRDAYDVHYGAMVAWADRLLLDTDLAHEVVTDAFAKLLKQDKNPEDARPTLYSAILRAVLDHWKQEGATPVRHATRADRPNSRSARTARSIGRSLPGRVRESFLLHWYAGLTVPEIVAVSSSNSRGVRRDLAEAKSTLESAVGSLDDMEIEEFFAAERAVLVPEAAGPDHWEQIVHQAGQEKRSWFWPLAAALGVVALVLSAWAVQQDPFRDQGVRSGQQVGTASPAAPAGTDGPARETLAPQPPGPVPPTFVPWSLSNAGSGTLMALGSANCAGGEICPTLARSTDDGTTWTEIHTFEDSDTASVARDEVPRIQPNRAVTEVRFADPKVGFAFGGDLWHTRDGGRSFVEYPHPGETVLDVVVSQREVVVLTADGCTQGRCIGPLLVSRAKVGATGISQPSSTPLTLAGDRPIDSAQLVLSDGDVFVQPYRVDGNLDPPWRLDGRELIPMRSGSACGNDPLQSLTATSNGTPTLFALCGGELRGQQAVYQLMRSTDQGKSWSLATKTPVEVPRIGRLTLTAGDTKRLAVAAGGPRKVADPTTVSKRSRLLQTTGDSGRTWKPVTKPLPPPQGVDWVSSVGGPEIYAITRTSAEIWRTADYGKKWSVIDPSQARRTSTATSATSLPKP